MNKQELIKHIEDLPYTEGPIADTITINRNWILESIEQLAESETGNADEAPRYVKNILARLRELPLHNREVWLKVIMSEFKQDFSHAKWREGYEQGKFEGEYIPEKVTIPQFVADWIEESKKHCKNVVEFFRYKYPNVEMIKWIQEGKRFDLIARAWLDGYEVEKEKKYIVTLKSSGQKLYYHTEDEDYIFSSYDGVFYSGYHTKTDLEENDMSWVFDCPGIEVEEVEQCHVVKV